MKPLLDNLEKEALELYNEQSGINYEVAIRLSQAVSLKRIADVIEKELATMIISGRDNKS